MCKLIVVHKHNAELLSGTLSLLFRVLNCWADVSNMLARQWPPLAAGPCSPICFCWAQSGVRAQTHCSPPGSTLPGCTVCPPAPPRLLQRGAQAAAQKHSNSQCQGCTPHRLVGPCKTSSGYTLLRRHTDSLGEPPYSVGLGHSPCRPDRWSPSRDGTRTWKPDIRTYS